MSIKLFIINTTVVNKIFNTITTLIKYSSFYTTFIDFIFINDLYDKY